MFSKKELDMFRKAGVKAISFMTNQNDVSHIEFFPSQVDVTGGLTPKQIEELSREPTPEETLYGSSD